jgi:hypothetical protein
MADAGGVPPRAMLEAGSWSLASVRRRTGTVAAAGDRRLKAHDGPFGIIPRAHNGGTLFDGTR